jgi:hypothetical protein
VTDVPPTTEANRPEHGTQAANERALSVVPMPQGTPPGGRGPLTRPTERPGEPITAGLAVGPGPGPAVPQISEADQIRAIYRSFPSEELRHVVELLNRRGL